MRTLLLVVFAFQTASLLGAREISDDYTVSVDGRPVEVIRVPTPERAYSPRLKEPYSYAMFTSDGACEVTVKCSITGMASVAILPESKGVKPLRRTGDSVTFRMTPPMTLAVEPAGRDRALVITAAKPERNAPKEGDRGVHFFGPGYHKAGIIRLGDAETLYLAPGAWVEGAVVGRGRGMKICGQGVLSGASWKWCAGPSDPDGIRAKSRLVRLSGEDIDVRDVTLFSSYGWTLVFDGVTNAVADCVKIIGGRVINDDGIDVCRAKGVTVRNCFIRAQDDSVAPKWWCEDLTVSNCVFWADFATAVRIGYECEDGATGLKMRNLVFRDIDVLHLSVNKAPPTKYWTEVAFLVQPSHDQVFENILIENVRFHEAEKRDYLLVVRTQPITEGFQFDHAGTLRGLTLRDIHLPPSNGGMGVWLEAHDEAHPVEGVRFENVTGYGPVVRRGEVDFRVK